MLFLGIEDCRAGAVVEPNGLRGDWQISSAVASAADLRVDAVDDSFPDLEVPDSTLPGSGWEVSGVSEV